MKSAIYLLLITSKLAITDGQASYKTGDTLSPVTTLTIINGLFIGTGDESVKTISAWIHLKVNIKYKL
jgi:hypothetical protein